MLSYSLSEILQVFQHFALAVRQVTTNAFFFITPISIQTLDKVKIIPLTLIYLLSSF